MKLVFICFICLCSLANTTTTSSRSLENRKLQETLKELNDVRDDLQKSEKLLNTPPQNTEDCCSLSALKCFHTNIKHIVEKKKHKKLDNSLGHRLTLRGLNFCNNANATFACPACDSHPKENVKVFLNRLESFIQMGITRLNMQ